MQSSVPLQPQINHQILLVNLRKSIELWFLDKRHQSESDDDEDGWDDLYFGIQKDIAAIISDGLQLSLVRVFNYCTKLCVSQFARDYKCCLISRFVWLNKQEVKKVYAFLCYHKF